MRKHSDYLWDDAARQWLQETAYKRSHCDDRAKLIWIGCRWNGWPLTAIDRMAIQQLAQQKLAEALPATVNRYLALIRAILRRACREWEWIERVPYVRLFPERARRVSWITPEQARRLLDELPQHQRDLVLFALSTGLRQSNVLGLRWDQVDLRRLVVWFYGDQVKNGEDLLVSLNDTALDVLRRRRGLHPVYVFSWRGKRLKSANTRAWKLALARAGIENFRWHDLRHTWASWLVQQGVSLYALQEMGGWKSAVMVRKYAHFAPAHHLRHAKLIDQMLQPLAEGS